MAESETSHTGLAAVFARFVPEIATRRLLLRAAVSAAFGVFLMWLNPLNISSKSDEASGDVFQRIMAPLIHDRPNPDPVVLVLYTFEGLESLRLRTHEDWNWPLTFDRQADLLEKIVARKPRAVFFDLAFYQPRSGLSEFADAIQKSTGVSQDDRDGYVAGDFCSLREAHERVPKTPVFLAEAEGARVLPELCAAGAEGVSTAWIAPHNAYGLIGTSGRKTAATRMFEDWCNGPTGRFADLSAACFPLPRDAAQSLATIARGQRDDPPDPHYVDTTRPLNLTWGIGANPDQRRVGTQDLHGESCAYDLDGFWHRLRQFAAHLSSAGLWEQSARYFGCMPAPLAIPASEILHPEIYGRPSTDDLLKNKFVIIGADFPGMRDRLDSPVYGDVAGAYAHAIALENLLEMGPRYIKVHPLSDIPWRLNSINFLVVALTLFAMLWALERAQAGRPPAAILIHDRHGPNLRVIRRALGDFGFCVFALLLLYIALFTVACLLFFGMRVAPLDWLGIGALVAGLAGDEIASASLAALLILFLLLPPVRWAARMFVEAPSMDGVHE